VSVEQLAHCWFESIVLLTKPCISSESVLLCGGIIGFGVRRDVVCPRMGGELLRSVSRVVALCGSGVRCHCRSCLYLVPIRALLRWYQRLWCTGKCSMPMRECWEALAALKCAYCWFELFERLIKSPSCPSRRYFVVVSATLVHREALCALEGTVGGSCGAQVCAVLM
jgi:hypothetical protein